MDTEQFDSRKSKDYDHFSAIPWCAKLLSSPDLTVWTPLPRLDPSNSLETVMAETLNTPSTLPGFLYFHAPHPPLARVDEIRALVTLGPGVSGYTGTCHGGILALILDSCLSQLGVLNMTRGAVKMLPYMTRTLNVEYLRVVRVPQTVVVTARILREKNDNYDLDCVMADERGRLLTKCASVFLNGLKSGVKAQI